MESDKKKAMKRPSADDKSGVVAEAVEEMKRSSFLFSLQCAQEREDGAVIWLLLLQNSPVCVYVRWL